MGRLLSGVEASPALHRQTQGPLFLIYRASGSEGPLPEFGHPPDNLISCLNTTTLNLNGRIRVNSSLYPSKEEQIFHRVRDWVQTDGQTERQIDSVARMSAIANK